MLKSSIVPAAERPKLVFPQVRQLVQHIDPQFYLVVLVLAVTPNNQEFRGVLLYKEQTAGPVVGQQDNYLCCAFEPFKGSITLSNEELQ